MYADRLMNTYVNIATSGPVIQELMQRLDLSEPPEVDAEIIANTELFKITVENTDPSMAAAIANTLADVLIAQSSELFIGGGKSLTEVLGEQLNLIQDDLESTRQEYEDLLAQTPAPENIETTRQLLQLKQTNYATLLSQYEQARSREAIQASMITVFETAVVPDTPSRPRVLLTVTLGFITGLVGGLGLAFILENLDTTLYDIEDIKATAKLPTFGEIPGANKKERNNFQEKFSPFAESFRDLATKLEVSNHSPSKKVLLLMSAEPNQGKSMITFHLACSLAELGKRVVAVDCDTRMPKLHSFFHLPNEIGLKDVLEQKVVLEDALQMCPSEDVRVLTSGSRFAHPSQMLGSIQMGKLIKNLSQQFDYVLLDSPAMLAVADVAALTPKASGLILIVRRAHAKKESVQAATDYLAKQNGKPAILIINEGEKLDHYYYYKDRKNLGSLFGALRSFAKQIREYINRPS